LFGRSDELRSDELRSSELRNGELMHHTELIRRTNYACYALRLELL